MMMKMDLIPFDYSSARDKDLEFTKDGIANIRDRILDALEHEMILRDNIDPKFCKTKRL